MHAFVLRTGPLLRARSLLQAKALLQGEVLQAEMLRTGVLRSVQRLLLPPDADSRLVCRPA